MDEEKEVTAAEQDAITDENAVSEETGESQASETPAICETEEAQASEPLAVYPDAEGSEESSEEDAEQQKPKTFREKITFSLYDLASVVGTAVITIMVVFTFLWRFVGVVGPSMQPTLYEGDWLAVAAVPKTPKAGDVVIVTQDNAFHEPIVKRVIATEGQTIDIRDGHVYVDSNDEPLVETYISPDVITEREDRDDYPLTVPEGKVFVMGDNRQHSTDSRSYAIDLIDTDFILGRVSFRIMPFGKWKVGMEYTYN